MLFIPDRQGSGNIAISLVSGRPQTKACELNNFYIDILIIFGRHVYRIKREERSGSVAECLTETKGQRVRASQASLHCAHYS